MRLAAAALLSTVVACGGSRSREAVGVSSGGASPVVARLVDGGAPPVAEIPSDLRTQFTKVSSARFASNGHNPGRYDVDVWANDAARGAMAVADAEFPPGARLVIEHFQHASDGTPGATGPLMMMEKRGGAWRYLVLDSSRTVVADGAVESCVGCHLDAPHDHVFITPEMK